MVLVEVHVKGPGKRKASVKVQGDTQTARRFVVGVVFYVLLSYRSRGIARYAQREKAAAEG